MGNRFEAVAIRWLNPVLRNDPEWMCACPFCEGTSSLQFNVEKGLWLCFKCDERGSAEKLVKKLGGSYTNPVMDLDDLEDSLIQLDMPQVSLIRPLPESVLGRYKGPPHEHWTKHRKFSARTIEEFQLGYDPISDRLTIPFRNPHGDLLGVIQRRLDDEFPRYLYPRGFDRKGSLFGSWHHGHGGRHQHAVLVEGSTDAIWVQQQGPWSLAQYGSSLHLRQARLLLQLGINEVTLFYDFDPAGLKAFKQAPEVLNGVIVRRVFYDESRYCWHDYLCGCKEGHNPFQLAHCQRKIRCLCGRRHCPDPGSLSKKEVQNMLENTSLVGKDQKWLASARTSSRSGKSALLDRARRSR